MSSKTKIISNEEWRELISCFDYDYFMSLDYSNCNVCVDGCDEIIRITKDDAVHELRYNPHEDIEGLELLQEKLREYTEEFYPEN